MWQFFQHWHLSYNAPGDFWGDWSEESCRTGVAIDDQWHTFRLEYDGADRLLYYFDGELVCTQVLDHRFWLGPDDVQVFRVYFAHFPGGAEATLEVRRFAVTVRPPPVPEQSEAAKILIAGPVHPYRLAYTASRHVLETDDGSLYIFFWESEQVIARVVDRNGVLASPSTVSHVPVSPGFSVALVGGRFYVTYTDTSMTEIYLRSMSWSGEAPALDEPVTVRSNPRSFSLQLPSLGVVPDGRFWIVYRDNAGPAGFIVLVIRALASDGQSWGKPEQISTAAHVADSFYRIPGTGDRFRHPLWGHLAG